MLEKYKKILKEEGVSGKDMAKLFGMEYSSYRYSTRSGAKVVPKWVRSFVTGYELAIL